MKSIDEMTVTNILKSKEVYLNILNGWSISIFITAIIIVLNIQMKPSAFSPNIDSDSCWFAETYSVSNYECKYIFYVQQKMSYVTSSVIYFIRDSI